ncbi:MAG: 1-acyl-sn-glycerol-3-phosphate acyltransferase [Paracoccaceae bacterium]|jgi:1-acyl-sn-glycerol-3-phosphate acyltransferase
MSDPSWNEATPPTYPRAGAARIALAVVRLVLVLGLTLTLLAAFVTVKGAERVFPGLRRLRNRIASAWGRSVARALGIRVVSIGAPIPQGGAIVANHSSWTDILVLLAATRVTFVSKAEVRNWPGIGIMARAADTLFIERRRSHAKRQEQEMKARIAAGQHLLFFPEATSTDGRRVIPFKSTLFSVFFTPELKDSVWVQPVSVVYRARPDGGRPLDFYGWWGDMDFGSHIWVLLTRSFGGTATVVFHPAVRAADFAHRKALAAYCDSAVRQGLEDHVGPAPTPITER